MKKIDTIITLNDVEVRIAKHVAKRRYDNNMEKGVRNAKVGGQNDAITNLEGFAGELAFCKLFNIFPDYEIYPRTSADDDGDCEIDGNRIDVKTTKYFNGSLLAPRWSKNKVQTYALMIGELPTYIFKGFMTKDELRQSSRLGTLGHGETFMAEQRELKEFEDL